MLYIRAYSYTLHFSTFTIEFATRFLRKIHSYLPSYFHSYTEFDTIYLYIEETPKDTIKESAPHVSGVR